MCMYVLYIYIFISCVLGIGSLEAPTTATSCAENSVDLAKVNILQEIESN